MKKAFVEHFFVIGFLVFSARKLTLHPFKKPAVVKSRKKFVFKEKMIL